MSSVTDRRDPCPAWEVGIKAGRPRAHQEEFGHQRAQDITHWQRMTCQNTQVAGPIVSCRDASSPGVYRNTPPSTNQTESGVAIVGKGKLQEE